MGFQEYKKVLDLSSLQLSLTSDSTYKDRYEMLSIRQLNKAIDSIEKKQTTFESKAELFLYQKT